MSETRFDIVDDDQGNSFLSVTAKDEGIQMLVVVDQDDIEELRAALPKRPPDCEGDDDE